MGKLVPFVVVRSYDVWQQKMASNKWYITQLTVVRYLDKLVHASYTLFTLIRPLALHKAS